MKVIKFGGTSVGSANSILSVKRIVEAVEEPVIVVVSALGGITDKLINTSKMAAAGDAAYENEFREIVYRHVEMIKEVIPAGEGQVELQRQIGELLNELKDIFQGIYLIKDLSQKTSDTIVSYGERLSSIIVAELTGAEWFDSRKFIKTEKKHSKYVLDTELTNELIRETFSTLPKRALVPGFISTDKVTGDVTNLGRGGSDYTASVIAAALDADQLEIWTDVDGFMTADPRVISTAYTINELSYVEATELCNFGAKVVYPPTIYPVCHKNIPILIKNTFNPEGTGTIIRQEVSDPRTKAIKGISSINDTSLITVQGLGMVGVIGVNYRIFKALAKNGISVFLVSQASSENSTSIGVRNADADLACEVLNEEFAKEIEMGEISPIQAEKNLATVAIVGENMKHTPGIAGKLFGTLGRNGINVIACAQGASETNISFVVDSKSLRKSLNVIHDSFFLSEYQVLNLFICGIGTVGGSLVEQIRCQQQKLMMENGLKLHIVGIADADRAMFSREGFDLTDFRAELAEKGKPSTLETLRDEIIGMNIFNSVFVDCTASAAVASLYKDLLLHNVSVVAANKIAASSEYENYRELKQIARQRGVKYLFETNVGAGLPIINTINDLIHSGDKILKIEAVLSGTLNYIFNKISADIPFSKTIKMAQEERYSEPDPRIDLSGKDVIRKLVILAREAGYRLEQSDVEKNLFVPDDFFEGSLDDFWKKVPSLDADFEARRKVLEAENKHWRFVAKLENGKASVGLQEVGVNHPFYGLEGSNNIILLTTERYKEYPMMIQGYGAGAGVPSQQAMRQAVARAERRKRDKLWTFGLRAGAGVSFWSFKDDLKAQFGSSSEQVSFTSNPRLGFAASAFAERYFNRTGHGHLGVGVGYMQNGGSTEGTVQDESFTYDMRYDAFAVDVYYGMRPVKNGFYMRYGLRLQLPVGMKLRMGASPNLAGLIEGTDTDVALDTWYDVDKELRKSIVPAVNLTYGYTFGHADIGLQWAMAFASPHQEMGKSPWSLSLDFAYRF